MWRVRALGGSICFSFFCLVCISPVGRGSDRINIFGDVEIREEELRQKGHG
jgi:hypothetical protein